MDPTPPRLNPGRTGRVSRRRYMARRAAALVVLVGFVAAIAGGVNMLMSGSGDSAADEAPPSSEDGETGGDSDETNSSTPVAGGEGAASPADEPAGNDGEDARAGSNGGSDNAGASQEGSGGSDGGDAFEDSGEPSPPPSPQHPASVYIAGDSDAGLFGPYLDELLGNTGVADITLDYEVSSGLARPDFFDWPEHLQETIPEIDPDIVVVTFGGNDAQGLSEEDSQQYVVEPADVEPAAWRAEYGERVGEVMDYLSSDGRTLIWVGIPNTEDHGHSERLRIQNEVVREQIDERSDVQFVDTWSRFSGRDGGYADYVIDPRDGQGKPVRADDNFHLNGTGAEILALDIAEVVREELRDRGADL